MYAQKQYRTIGIKRKKFGGPSGVPESDQHRSDMRSPQQPWLRYFGEKKYQRHFPFRQALALDPSF